MRYQSVAFSGLLLSATAVSAKLFKRDSWGPSLGLGPSTAQILTTETTFYPGKMPADQAAYLFCWLGISNGTGDLIQSIVGSYPSGQSECSGSAANTAWCISSEVYGTDAATGEPNQWVGSLTTADVNYTNGVIFNYTLTDKATYTWVQTMRDAVTGALLSTYTKNSGPMLGWGTALECDDYNGVACTGTSDIQYYVNSTIVLEAADPDFSSTLGLSSGATNTDMETADGGITWTIAKITIPAMEAAASSDDTSSSSSSAAASSTVASSSVVAESATIATSTVAKSSTAVKASSSSSSVKLSSTIKSATTAKGTPASASTSAAAETTTEASVSASASAAASSTASRRHHGHGFQGFGGFGSY